MPLFTPLHVILSWHIEGSEGSVRTVPVHDLEAELFAHNCLQSCAGPLQEPIVRNPLQTLRLGSW